MNSMQSFISLYGYTDKWDMDREIVLSPSSGQDLLYRMCRDGLVEFVGLQSNVTMLSVFKLTEQGKRVAALMLL